MSTYVSELRGLAEDCNYGPALDDILCDRMVCGINDASIEHRLISEQDLTFKKAHTLALGMEMAGRNVQALQRSVGAAVSTVKNPESSETTVHKILHPASPRTERKTCYCCGKTGHFQINAILRMHIVTLAARRGILLRCASPPTVESLLQRRYVKSLVEKS